MLAAFRPGEDRMLKGSSPSQERLLWVRTEVSHFFRSSEIRWMTRESCKFLVAIFCGSPQNRNSDDLGNDKR